MERPGLIGKSACSKVRTDMLASDLAVDGSCNLPRSLHAPKHRLINYWCILSSFPAATLLAQVSAMVENQEPYFSLLCQALDLFNT